MLRLKLRVAILSWHLLQIVWKLRLIFEGFLDDYRLLNYLLFLNNDRLNYLFPLDLVILKVYLLDLWRMHHQKLLVQLLLSWSWQLILDNVCDSRYLNRFLLLLNLTHNFDRSFIFTLIFIWWKLFWIVYVLNYLAHNLTILIIVFRKVFFTLLYP